MWNNILTLVRQFQPLFNREGIEFGGLALLNVAFRAFINFNIINNKIYEFITTTWLIINCLITLNVKGIYRY